MCNIYLSTSNGTYLHLQIYLRGPNYGESNAFSLICIKFGFGILQFQTITQLGKLGSHMSFYNFIQQAVRSLFIQCIAPPAIQMS